VSLSSSVELNLEIVALFGALGFTIAALMLAFPSPPARGHRGTVFWLCALFGFFAFTIGLGVQGVFFSQSDGERSVLEREAERVYGVILEGDQAAELLNGEAVRIGDAYIILYRGTSRLVELTGREPLPTVGSTQ